MTMFQIRAALAAGVVAVGILASPAFASQAPGHDPPASQGEAGTGCGQPGHRELRGAGEAAMAAMAGSPAAHRAMDRAMGSMLGSTGLARMHEMMGSAACGDAAGMGAGMRSMMGMMTGMSGASMGAPGPSELGGMMGDTTGGEMMSGGGDDDGGGLALGEALLVGLLTALAAIGLLWLVARRPWAARGAARRLLDERLARGEIDVEEHRRRAAIVGG
ncbi:MAG: hypothetical protein ACRDY6_18455 [Acidimicrobiia bacterium]